MKTLVLVLFVTLLGLGCSKDRDNTQVAQSNRVEPDNSGVNIRDRSDATKTPSDQSENETDRTITQNARDAITDDSSLSTNAKALS